MKVARTVLNGESGSNAADLHNTILGNVVLMRALTDFSEITDEFVSWIENKLNNRPRKRLGYLTPNEKFNLLLTNQNSIAFVS